MTKQATLLAACICLMPGCGASFHQASRHLAQAEEPMAPLAELEDPPGVVIQGALEEYVALALERNPDLRASFERWRAAVHRIPQAGRLAEPTLTYGYFIRSVETRVGPQRHRLGVSFSFPWPTSLAAGTDGAAKTARSYQRRFESHALAVARDVAQLYWELWLVEQTRDILQDQRVLFVGLVESLRGRLALSSGSLADVNQAGLAVSQLDDRAAALDAKQRALSAELLATVGSNPGEMAPVRPTLEPGGGLPALPVEVLSAAARNHPQIGGLRLMEDASHAHARRARADRAPSFAAGFQWIETGPAPDPTLPGSGRDPLIVSFGVRLPLWAYAYRGAEEEAESLSRAYRAESVAARRRAEAALVQILATIGDADRRNRLYRDTMVPQAEGAYESVLGAYQTGKSTLGSILIAQRAVLDLALGLAQAQATHATAWARLEHIVGQAVPSRAGAGGDERDG